MSANKPAFEEYQLGDKYVLRFYRVDHGLVCTINESMVQELREVIEELNEDAWKYKELCK